MKLRTIVIAIICGAGVMILLLLPNTEVRSQDGSDDPCTTLLNDALQIVGSTCAEMGRNEACYGHYPIRAELAENADGQFAEDGDLIEITDLQSLETEAANPETGEWGVALMLVQADLPDASEAAMTFVLFGDTQVQSAGQEVTESPSCTAINAGTSNINMRGLPSTNGAIVTTISAGTETIASGRNEAGDWLFVEQDNDSGWVYGSLFSADCDIATLPILDGDASVAATAPMQAITVQSGDNQSCESIPDGLLIRSPEGRRARVVVNGVDLVFSSAGFITAQSGGDMMVRGLEGQIEATVGGVTETILPDTFATIPLDANLQPNGSISPPQIVDTTQVHNLPALQAVSTMLIENEIGTEVCGLSVESTVNLRGGPSTVYDRVGSVEAGEEFAVIGTADGQDGFVWWQLAGGWVRADLVNLVGDCSRVSTVDDIPPTPTPRPTASNGGGGTNEVTLWLGGPTACQFPEISLGTSILISFGTGRATEAEAQQAMSVSNSSITINGQSVPVYRGCCGYAPNNPPSGLYGYWTRYLWTPDSAGVYSIVGAVDGNSNTCTVTITT